MGKKATKATRKFAASGQLKKTIDNRRKHSQIKKKIQSKKTRKEGKAGNKGEVQVDDEADDDSDEEQVSSKMKGMSVDDFLGAGFMEGSDDDEDMVGANDEDGDESEDGDGDIEDDASFASIDDLEHEGEDHVLELKKLAEKDPEFYKYLQENDRELLEFEAGAAAATDDDDDMFDEDEDMSDDKAPVLTKTILQKWQKALLEHRSLRALRKLLLAFRAAAHMNEENQVLAWTIDSPSVYSKLVTTSLRYTPVVLEHHIPYKILPNGKFKPPTQTTKHKTLQKLIISYFINVIHIISQLTEPEMIQLAISESAKIVPYVISSRRSIKLYLKTCLDIWSTGDDSTRIAAFLAIRKLATATDESMLDMVLKGTYLALIRSSKSTTPHTLPSINLMKNSASEIYCLDFAQGSAYQHAFGYIRQLAVHLRNSMKVKSKEAYKQVYNWQYVHCIDFWCIVLARACDVDTQGKTGAKDNELKPLIYPLVQVTLGAIKLISASRSYPFHLHLIRSLLHLTRHTNTFIPLAPYLLPIINSALSPTHSKKSSTLRPLDFDTNIRAPQQYAKTRVYAEGLLEEALFVLSEWLAAKPVMSSIAFPEITVPVVMSLRKTIKTSKSAGSKGGGSAKEAGMVKGLVERIEESAKWVEKKREGVAFSPGRMNEVEAWEAGVNVEETPLGKYVKVQRKTREKRRRLVEKAREGEHEILDD